MFQRNGLHVIAQAKHVADGRDGPVVHQLRELAIVVEVAAAYGILHGLHHIRIDHVVFAAMHKFHQASLTDLLAWQPGIALQAFLVMLQVNKARTLDAAE